MFISVHICAYMCICVHISAFQIPSYNSVYPMGVWPCVHGEAQAMVREARFWAIITDTYDIHGYGQICSCEYSCISNLASLYLAQRYKHNICEYLNYRYLQDIGRYSHEHICAYLLIYMSRYKRCICAYLLKNINRYEQI